MHDDKMVRRINIDYGWALVVMVTSYLGIIILSIALYMNGVIYVELLERYGEGEAKTSLVGALCSGLLCCLAPGVGALNNKLSSRFSMILGGVISTTGFAICAFVKSLAMIIVFNGVFVGIGFALSMSGMICVVGFYFEKHRDIVLSVAFLTVGIAMFVSAPFGLYLLDMYGLTATYLIQASIQAQMCVFGALSRPSVIERQVQKQKQTERKQSLKMKSNSYIDVTLLKNRPYLCILFSISTWNFCLSAGFIHLPNYVSVHDGSNSDISLIMLLFSVANFAGRLLGSITVSRWHGNIAKIYAIELAISGVITALFPLYSKIPGGLYIFSIQLGIFTGWPNTMMMPISLDYVGVSKLSEAYGYYYLFCGVGFFTGPVFIGYIYGVTGSYENSFIVAGAVLFLGGVSAATSFCCKDSETTDSEALSTELTIMDVKNIRNFKYSDTKLGASLLSIHSGSLTDLMSCSRSQNLYFKDTNSVVNNDPNNIEENGLLNKDER